MLKLFIFKVNSDESISFLLIIMNLHLEYFNDSLFIDIQ